MVSDVYGGRSGTEVSSEPVEAGLDDGVTESDVVVAREGHHGARLWLLWEDLVEAVVLLHPVVVVPVTTAVKQVS